MQTIAKRVADQLGNQCVSLGYFEDACSDAGGQVILALEGDRLPRGGVRMTQKFPDGSAISLHTFGLEVFSGPLEAPVVLSNGKFLRPGWSDVSTDKGVRHAG